MSMNNDRVMPQNMDVEKAVLGACLLGDVVAIDQARAILTPEAFYHSAHRKIFSAICAVSDRGEPVDQITVTAELGRMGALETIGGGYTVASMMHEMATSSNIEHHARIVYDAYVRRHIIIQCGQISQQCFAPDSDTNDVLAQMGHVEQGIRTGEPAIWTSAGDAVERALDKVEWAWQNPGKISGITTGLADIDDMLDGLQDQDLILVAGRTSMGKTAMGLHMARTASAEVPVGIVSVEMGVNSLGMRLLSAEARVDGHQMRRGKIGQEEWTRLLDARNRIRAMNIHICDSKKDPNEIRREARRLKRERDVGLIIVDYLQLLDPPKGSGADNREREVAAISATMKFMAKDLDVPVVAMCQLSRAVESRQNKRPMLSDLRESGSLEQDADVVIFLYLPEYYGVHTEKDDRGVETDINRRMEVHVAKQRNGPTGTTYAYFEKPSGYFGNWTLRQEEPAYTYGGDNGRF